MWLEGRDIMISQTEQSAKSQQSTTNKKPIDEHKPKKLHSVSEVLDVFNLQYNNGCFVIRWDARNTQYCIPTKSIEYILIENTQLTLVLLSKKELYCHRSPATGIIDDKLKNELIDYFGTIIQ